MQQILLGFTVSLIIACSYLYSQNQNLKEQIIRTEEQAKIQQQDFDNRIIIATIKQKQLEIQISKQQQERKKQQIILQDKKCITQEFINIINENF